MKTSISASLGLNAILLGLASAAIVQATADNIVVNGDFEEPVVPGEQGWEIYYGGQSFLGWTVGGHSIDIVHDHGIREWWVSPSGHQGVDLNGQGPGSITQYLPTLPGAAYVLSFAMAGNQVGDPIVVTMDFFWGEEIVDTLSFLTITPAPETPGDIGWAYHQYTLVASTDLTRLKFESLSNTGARGPALDDVQVVLLDTDGDGVADDFDQCPFSVAVGETVVIGACDTGVPNAVLETGCTLSDLILERMNLARNKGQFVSDVAHLKNSLVKQFVITPQQGSSIQAAAAKDTLP
jgi:choice-of-anchor C domain-containing protein